MTTKGGSAAMLDELEARLLADARRQLGPDDKQLRALYCSVAAAGALGPGALGSTLGPGEAGVGSSVGADSLSSGAAPALSAPGTVAPPGAGVGPSLHPSGSNGPPPGLGAEKGTRIAAAGGRLAQATFGLKSLVGAALCGALIGYALGSGGVLGTVGTGVPATVQQSNAPVGTASTDVSGGAPLAVLPPGSAAPDSDDPSAEPAEREVAAGRKPLASKATGQELAPNRSNRAEEETDRRAAAPDQQAVPTFYEELAYLKRAQAALRSGDPSLALGLMRSLDEIQPGGALHSERAVTKVLALCGVGDVEGATKIARHLALKGTASVYAERLEQSCAKVAFSAGAKN